MKMVKVALVGIGQHMQRILYPALLDCPVEIVAICDADMDKAQVFASTHRVGRVYPNAELLCVNEPVDAVVCAANSTAHYEVARLCASQGIPVFIEKTPCDTREQARMLAELEARQHVLIQTGFNRRFATGYIMAKEIIGRETFGRPTQFFSKFNASPYANERFFLTNHVLHHLDLARFFLGELQDLHLRRVCVDKNRFGFQLDAVSSGGAVVCIQSNSLQDIHYPMERVEITGIGQLVVIDNMRSLQYHRPATDKSHAETARMCDGADALCWHLNLGYPFVNEGLGNEDEIRHFIDAVRGTCAPLLPFSESLGSMELLYDVLDLYEQLS